MIKREILENGKLELIGIECYVCGTEGHVAVECPSFGDIKGNLNTKKRAAGFIPKNPDIGFGHIQD